MEAAKDMALEDSLNTEGVKAEVVVHGCTTISQLFWNRVQNFPDNVERRRFNRMASRFSTISGE